MSEEPASASPILRAILAGLQEVKDITHRDLKPANILPVHYQERDWSKNDLQRTALASDQLTRICAGHNNAHSPLKSPNWALEISVVVGGCA